MFVFAECRFDNNDTAIFAQNAWGLGIGGCLFRWNEVAFVTIDVVADMVGASVFAFNGVCLTGQYVPSPGGCVFYKNTSLGDVVWEGCNLEWPAGDLSSQESGETALERTIVINADPLFCDSTLVTGADVSVYSPALPDNNVCAARLGYVSVGCDCGDADMQMGINVADLAYLVDYLFHLGPAPAPIEAGETDGVLGVNVADITYLVAHLFQGGPGPVCP